MRRPPIPLTAIVVGLVLAPLGASGTPSQPELVDPEGDVEYHAAWSDPQPSDHLDILALWYGIDTDARKLNITLRLKDLDESLGAAQDRLVQFRIEVETAIEGEPSNVIEVFADTADGGQTWAVRGTYVEDDGGSTIARDLGFSFEWIEAAPGLIVLSTDAVPIRGFATDLVRHEVTAGEAENVAAGGVNQPSPVQNQDVADSDVAFSLEAVPPANGSGETPAASPPNATRQGPVDDTEGGLSAGPGIFATMLAAAAMTMARRRRG